MNEDMYNVSKYTDNELYQILDLVNPSDRELEAKIIYFLNKYSSIRNTSGKQLYDFFNNIYNRFFDEDDEDGQVVENLDTDGSRQYVFNGSTGEENSINYGNTNMEYGSNANLSGNLFSMGNTDTPSNAVVGQTIDPTTDYRKDDVKLTKTLDYSKDKLNPLLKQTVRRIISIDSSYRPNQNDLATDFTFNLSDSLRDVLSLKLYSVQIPYTWYTISKQYGSNFFYLKGNSPGITSGDHDYQIKIDAGNYTPANLISAINTSIQTMASTYTDVSFGNTMIEYNSVTSAATITVDINKTFNENRYYLYFPTWTSPLIDTSRNQSIPGFLGYNDTSYNISTIYSKRTLSLTTSTSNSDSVNSVFSINTSNRYFTIKQYQGYSEYDSTSSSLINSYDVAFSSNISNGNTYTRNQLFDDLSGSIVSNSYLSNSFIRRIDITDPFVDSCGNSFYKMNLQLNQKTTSNIKNYKTVVVFPSESGDNTIWSGSTSCFNFDPSRVELNNIYSETSTTQTNYSIVSSPYFNLKCIHAEYGYDASDTDYRNDFSGNDVSFNIVNSTGDGYTLSEYITALNNSLTTTNTMQDSLGILNMNNTKIYQSNTDSKIHFQFDLNKEFTKNNYVIDFSGTDLWNILDLSFHNIDLSNTNVFTSSFANNSSYTIDSSYIAIIKPNSSEKYGNQYANWYQVPPLYTSKTYTTISSLQTDINTAFANFTDSDGDSVLKGTTISLTNNSGIISSQLEVKVSKILTQVDYDLYFYDPSSNGLWDSSDENNTWYNYLNITDPSYSLSNYLVSGQSYSDISGSSVIYGSQITLSENSNNNYFYIKPLTTSNGIYIDSGENDIKITLDAGTYTRTQLINAINSAFDNNSLAAGSSVSVYTENGTDYSKIRLNVNKIFTASDFRLVFYDPYSFVKCYIGSSSVKNTTWDATIGWILGFRNLTEYTLTQSNEYVDPNDDTIIYYNDTGSFYSYNSTTNIVKITGDTAVSTNLYNYFLIVLDDFNQNHLNDGLVTITNAETDIPLPSYANRSVIECNPITGETIFSNTTGTQLTQNQVYATNEKLNSRKNKAKSFSNGPFVKDIFGLIPMKTSGLANGSTYIEFGGTLQNQDRTYFGPVNIHRMSIKLMNERGDVVDLNGSNWSFSLMCEQLYRANT
jgi:hypothetical protein